MLAAILQKYPWFDHPEGMKFAEMSRDEFRSVGHWLFLPGSISAFHRLTHCDEIWSLHTGRLSLHVIAPSGVYQPHVLGPDIAAGDVPVVTVPRGAWQAAELMSREEWAFGTNVCAPSFDYAHCEMAVRQTLIAALPQHRDLISRLTHGASKLATPLTSP